MTREIWKERWRCFSDHVHDVTCIQVLASSKAQLPCFFHLAKALAVAQIPQIPQSDAKVTRRPSPEISLQLPYLAMAIQQRVASIFARIQSLADKVVSPETRKQYYDKTMAFAHEQPLLFVCILVFPLILNSSFKSSSVPIC